MMTKAGTKDKTAVHARPELYIIFSVTLVIVLGVASITPAFPLLADTFQIDDSQTSWIIAAYFIPGVFLTPAFGVLADQFDRKSIVVPGLVAFGIAGIACGMAPNFGALLGFRAVQGAGAAAMGAINLTMIGDLFEGEERTKAMGYNAAVIGISSAVYPFIGGSLAEIAWYWPFAMPVLAFPVAAVVLGGLQLPEGGESQNSDEQLSKLFSHLRESLPALGVLFLSFAIFALLYGPYLNYFPIFLESTLDFSPLNIGVAMSSVSLCGALTAAVVGKLASRYKLTSLMTVGFFLYVGALAFLPSVDSIAGLFGFGAVYGVAHGLNVPSSQTMIANIAPDDARGTFMAMNTTMYRVAQTTAPLGVAIIHRQIGLSWVFWGGAIFALVVGIGLITRPLYSARTVTE